MYNPRLHPDFPVYYFFSDAYDSNFALSYPPRRIILQIIRYSYETSEVKRVHLIQEGVLVTIRTKE